VVVGYKNATLDPQYPSQYTTVEYRIAPVNRPEQGLMGIMYCGVPGNDCGVNSNVDYVVTNSANWVYANTGFKDGDRVRNLVGYEMDQYWSTSPLPSGITNRVILSQSPFLGWGGQSGNANSQIYQAASGAWVFAAGTVSWGLGLDNFWYTYADARIQQTTANIFNAFLNSAPVAARLQVTAPATATPGQAFTTTVSAVSAQGTVVSGYRGTVHFTSTDSQAVLPADYTFTSTDAGTHQFSVNLKTAGSQTITATDTVTSITGSQTVTVGASTATRLSLTGLSNATAGTAQTATVTLYDATGSRVTSYAGTVHFTSTDSQAALPADYTFTSADAGTHQFAVTLKTAGSQTVTATDTVTSSLTGNQTVTISAGAASRLSLTGLSSASAGMAQTATVTLYDANGNGASAYTGTVHFSSTDAQAGLPADYTFTSADAGAHLFSVTLKTAGSQTVTASDTVTSSLTGNQTVTISAGAASRLTLTGLSNASAGTAQTATVTLYDANGNRATYSGTVHFTSSDSQAVLPADYTFTSVDAGQHQFSVTLKTVGSQTVTATDTVTSSLTGSQTVTVSASTASRLSLTGLTNASAGTGQMATVTLYDANNNRVTGYTGTVHFSSTDSQAVLPADYTFTSADAGQHQFSVTLKTAGSQTVTATDTLTSSLTGSQTVTISSVGTATRLSLTGLSNATAGTTQTATVTLYDASGTRVTGYTGTVHFSSTDSQAGLPADYTFTSADAGQHQFSVTLKTAGGQTVTAADTVMASLTSTVTIQISAASAATLTITGPGTAKATQAYTYTVTLTDPYGNVATGYTGTVHFTSSDALATTSGNLPPDYTFTGADAGTHTFWIALRTAGTQTVTAADTANAALSGTATVQVTLI
jgi:hypothetical protein